MIFFSFFFLIKHHKTKQEDLDTQNPNRNFLPGVPTYLSDGTRENGPVEKSPRKNGPVEKKSPRKTVPWKKSPEKRSRGKNLRKNGPVEKVPRKTVPWKKSPEKWSRGKKSPQKNGPVEKKSPEKRSRGKNSHEKWSPWKEVPGKKVPEKAFSAKVMAWKFTKGKLNNFFFIFIDFYRHKKILNADPTPNCGKRAYGDRFFGDHFSGNLFLQRTAFPVPFFRGPFSGILSDTDILYLRDCCSTTLRLQTIFTFFFSLPTFYARIPIYHGIIFCLFIYLLTLYINWIFFPLFLCIVESLFFFLSIFFWRDVTSQWIHVCVICVALRQYVWLCPRWMVVVVVEVPNIL